MAGIRKITHKKVSRQSANVNLNQLERAGQVRRRPAPKGSGALSTSTRRRRGRARQAHPDFHQPSAPGLGAGGEGEVG